MLPGARRPRRFRRPPRWACLIICIQVVGVLWLCGRGSVEQDPPHVVDTEGTVVTSDAEPRALDGSVLRMAGSPEPEPASSLRSRADRARLRWKPQSVCAVDQRVSEEAGVAGVAAAAPALAGSGDYDGGSERFLVYSPQFGLSNQLVALRNAAGWASLLNRTLVVPHLVHGPPHASRMRLARHGAIFDVATAARRLAPALRVIEMRSFLPLGLTPARLVQLSTNTKFSFLSYDYLDAIGLSAWHRDAPPLRITLLNFEPDTIRHAFGSCAHHRVLALASLFGAFDPKPLSTPPADWLVPAAFGSQMEGLRFLDTRAVPSLFTPLKAVARIAADIAADVQRGGGAMGGEAGGAAQGTEGFKAGGAAGVALACVHVRRGDFEDECGRYDEEARSGNARQWIIAHYERGLSCWQSEAELRLNMDNLAATAAADGQTLAFYGSSDEPSIFGTATFRRHNVSQLSGWADQIRRVGEGLGGAPWGDARAGGGGAAVAGGEETGVPEGILQPILDQLVCSLASHLLLNVFSTFSQLVMGHIGVRRADRLGFVRSLTPTQQRAVGVRVDFWRRQNPFDEGKLLGIGVAWDAAQLQMVQTTGVVPETEAASVPIKF